MNSENFYSELPLLENFIEITDLGNFVDVSDDWYIILTDIRGSTRAIEAGRYKEVNLLGGCSIAGVYKDLTIAATDYRKFDNMLRMVISGDRSQREKLTGYLEKNYREGKLVYGLHVADRI
jgi:Protein of unknown function (DUF3095)